MYNIFLYRVLDNPSIFLKKLCSMRVCVCVYVCMYVHVSVCDNDDEEGK